MCVYFVVQISFTRAVKMRSTHICNGNARRMHAFLIVAYKSYIIYLFIFFSNVFVLFNARPPYMAFDDERGARKRGREPFNGMCFLLLYSMWCDHVKVQTPFLPFCSLLFLLRQSLAVVECWWCQISIAIMHLFQFLTPIVLVAMRVNRKRIDLILSIMRQRSIDSMGAPITFSFAWNRESIGLIDFMLVTVVHITSPISNFPLSFSL